MSGRPPSVAEVLRRTPKAGTGDEIRAASVFVRDVRHDASFLTVSASEAQVQLLQLQSRGVASIAVKLGQYVVPGAIALSATAKRATRALTRYAGEIDSIHARADRLRVATAASLSAITRAMAEIEEMCTAILVPFEYDWNLPPAPTLPEPRLRAGAAPSDPAERDAIVGLLRQTYDVRWRNTVLGWQSDLEEVRSSARSWSSLIDERGAVERALIGELRDTSVGQLITLGAGISGGRKRAIAVGLTGELGGIPRVVDALQVEHPLLAGIFTTRSGIGVWESPPEPAAVVRWWGALSEPERAELIRSVPHVVGNLPGLPAQARDAANRLAVEFNRANPQRLDAGQLKLVAEVQRILDAEASQDRPDPPIQVLAFSLSEAVPMVAVGYGDLDTATHTSWQAGGMGNDAPDGVSTWDTASRNLYDAQFRELRRKRGQAPGVIAWLGYDAPDMPPDLGVLASDSAVAGAARMAAEIDGLYASREAGTAGIPVSNVAAHSYGTTVASIALTLTKRTVDSFVMFGSAGLDTELVPSVESMNVATISPGQKAVFATNASADRIAPSGAALALRGLPTADASGLLGLGSRSPVYGGIISFPSDGDPARGLAATDGHPIVGQGQASGVWGLSASEGHGYQDRNTQSLQISVEIMTQQIAEETLALLAVSVEERVSSFVDPTTGLTSYIRRPVTEGTHNATFG